jgi:uncharacterized protein YdeI (YjbR/CyaY-like superfamily)
LTPQPQFFATPAAFRAWLKQNHKSATELHVGYHKKHTGKPSIDWPQSVAQALCFGWIDGIRRTIDEDTYVIRFSPRRAGSAWSAVNVRLVKKLEAEGKMTPAGRAVFEVRKNREGYSYEKMSASVSLDALRLRAFKKNKAAWQFFEAQPPGYKRKLIWWVMSAKQDATRDTRLARLMASSAAGKRLV